jgi:GNAT superfamily N-acetyltransferase
VALIIRSLDKAVHDRAAFDCGETPLNDFLKTKAAKHQAQRISRSFVLVDETEPKRILGYYSLSNCQIAREHLSEEESKKLPKHPIPAVMLARLAVDKSQQGKRIGVWLLMDAIKRCALIGKESGVYALLVDAKNASAKGFYEHFGFVAIAKNPLTLYLPLETSLKACLAYTR